MYNLSISSVFSLVQKPNLDIEFIIWHTKSMRIANNLCFSLMYVVP
jgi:hypothetical protein